MEEEVPRQGRRAAGSRWRPQAWSLRTKVSVVLLLPVIVALVLAGSQVYTELGQATDVSAVRDQLPVLAGTIDLANLIDEEMVAAVAPPGSTSLGEQMAASNAKSDAVLKAAAAVGLTPVAAGDLNTALGRLDGLRAANAATNIDAVTQASGYHDVLIALSGIAPDLVAPATSADLTKAATATEFLVQLRTVLAMEQALLRTAALDPNNRAALIAANHAAAEEAVITDQAGRIMPASLATEFAAAVATAPDRQNLLDTALTTGDTQALLGSLTPISDQSGIIGDLLTSLVNSLSNTATSLTDQARTDAGLDIGLVLAALLGAVAIALYVARSLISPVRRLHAAALDAAHRRLPETIERVRAGLQIDWQSVGSMAVPTGEEIGQLSRAFDEMQRQAVRLAGDQAELRRQVGEMFMTLARRSQSLVELQLSVIEELEADEQDPHRLENLFRVDHIAARLRRNGENLQVLAGGSPARPNQGPIGTAELLRAAMSEVKDYRRVAFGNAPTSLVHAHAAADVVHILAELLENAIRFSPPEDKVVLTADRGADGGVLIEVVDTGLGMTEEDIAAANERLAAGAAVTPETTRRMGLFVVGRLAAPHGVTVRLRRTLARATQPGITASVHVPGGLVIAAPDGAMPDATALHGPPQRLALNGAEAKPGAYEPAWPSEDIPEPITAPDAPTPIFDQIVAGWFIETPIPAPVAWRTPADTARRAAETAVRRPKRSPVGNTGLPVRKPGAQLAPGAARPDSAPDGPRSADFRDPVAVRNNLSRHYSGMLAARQRTRPTSSGDSGLDSGVDKAGKAGKGDAGNKARTQADGRSDGTGGRSARP